MITPCTCGILAKWVRYTEIPIFQCGSNFRLGDESIEDPALTIHYCPYCGELGRPHRGKRLCECGVMESLVEKYPHLLEFDAEMNEFHILFSDQGGKLQIYYCIACGGNPPRSLRHTFFEVPTELDYNVAFARIEKLINENDFIIEFGSSAVVFDYDYLHSKDIEIYGMKPVKKQWTFEPAGSLITYRLQLMDDGTYLKILGRKYKGRNNA